MNKLITIGYTGIKRCYLNVEMDEAIERFCKSEGYVLMSLEEIKKEGVWVDTIEFDDEFGAYEIYD